MLHTQRIIAALITGMFTLSAYAADTGSTLQRNVNQEQRIEQGLQSGELNTREAAKIEKGEAKIDKMEQRALSDGSMNAAEKARIERAQNAESRQIYDAKHNDVKGNPASASSRRLQTDVQRNVNQQTRINEGVKSGSLTDKEAARLEGGQARTDRQEARAGADGHVGAAEQRRIQRTENRQSKRIYSKKHDEKTAER
jgi:hypothetical protein